MKMMAFVQLIFLFACITVASSQEYNKSVVDHYVNLINERNQKAFAYEFPRNARIYEAADKEPEEYGEFDFVIVGAGTAGCIIANRLSEVSEWKILLLEAGTYRDDELTGIPQLWMTESFSKFNWGFYTTPQKYGCQGNVNKTCLLPRGKGVGGSTLINGMAMTRGNKLDYERWSELLDDPNWNYENVLPYFKQSEKFTKANPYVPIDQSYHGYNGLLHVTESYPPQETSLNFLRAGEQLGYNVTDYNGEQQLGFSAFQLNINKGKRDDFETAFLSPIKNRSNLVILDKSYVTSVNISPNKEVTGVTFTRENKTYIATNRKEVILSAGTISSPQILLLSGVGPEEDLQSLGIPVLQNLPVGQDLRDNTYTTLVFSTNITADYESMEKSVEDYLKTGTGDLTRAFIYDTVGWVSISEENPNYPDVEYIFFNLSKGAIFSKYLGWTEETFEQMDVTVPNTISIIIGYLRTKSIGTVKLKSCDPFEYPLINSNILSDPDDVESVYRSIQHVIELTKTEAFRSMNVTLTSDRFAPCNHLEPQSKEYWYCFIRITTGIGVHPVGTCLTGRDPQTGVVDKRLKVFGVKGLRVADGSVIPRTVTGHTNAVCAMVGEKASDIIKQDYQQL